MSEAIWQRTRPGLKAAGPVEVGEVLAAVHAVALDLLEAVSPPQRLVLRVGEVELDLDWRARPPARGHLPGTAEMSSDVKDSDHRPMLSVAGEAEDPIAEPGPRQHQVCAPSVGTFYRSAEPGGAPFVTEGTLVRAQQAVGIVEAMKLMLPVEAERSGRIVKVLVPDGGSVEFGEPLFLIDDIPVGDG